MYYRTSTDLRLTKATSVVGHLRRMHTLYSALQKYVLQAFFNSLNSRLDQLNFSTVLHLMNCPVVSKSYSQTSVWWEGKRLLWHYNLIVKGFGTCRGVKTIENVEIDLANSDPQMVGKQINIFQIIKTYNFIIVSVSLKLCSPHFYAHLNNSQ